MRARLIIVLILATGCKSEPRRLADELDRVSSWQATIAAIEQEKLLNRVPARYADDAIADARQKIAKSRKTIAELEARGVKPAK